jgi:putative CocE/NonD family hydrolase
VNRWVTWLSGAALVAVIGSLVHARSAAPLQTASAVQSAPVPIDTATVEKDGIRCHSEMVQMRDGTMLATDIYMPPSPGPHPVILQRTPYGHTLGHGCFTNTSGQMAFWAHNGYVGLTQDVRGTFRSHGTFQPFVQEQADGYDAVEWAAKQQWSNGKVGMAGSSYFGVTQWQAALTAPPHLLAIAPSVTSTDYHDHWTYVNGVFDLWFGQSWLLAFFAPDQYRRQAIARGMSVEDSRAAADEYLAESKKKIFTDWAPQMPLAGFPEYRTLAPYYYDWLAHPAYDDYWARVDVERQFGAIKVPAFITGGWYDLFSIGTGRSFEGMRQRGGSNLARNGTMLIMQGTGAHGGPGVIEPSPDNNAVDLRALQLRFYDRHVKGIDNGIDREPRVQLFVMVTPDAGRQSGGFWVNGDSFPPKGTGKVQFNLRSRGRANTRMGDGMLDPDRPSDGPEDRFTYDPMKPVPTLGGGLCCVTLGSYFPSGAQDQSELEMRDDVLVYTSPPLTKDLAVVGAVKLKFWAKSSARDTDFTAKFVDVHPDGFAQNLLDRLVRARFRKGSKSAPSLIQPGVPYEYEIDLGYTGALIRAGHRVRIDISSSNFPHYARNPNTGAHPAHDADVVVANQAILHDRTHPAYLELSVLQGPY